jgi:hypothetical protein
MVGRKRDGGSALTRAARSTGRTTGALSPPVGAIGITWKGAASSLGKALGQAQRLCGERVGRGAGKRRHLDTSANGDQLTLPLSPMVERGVSRSHGRHGRPLGPAAMMSQVDLSIAKVTLCRPSPFHWGRIVLVSHASGRLA